VLVIDEDLRWSGPSAEGRQGFQRLIAEVGLDHVGVILGVEVSRLARSSKDWHQLVEICALFEKLIADLNGIYDPSQYHDPRFKGWGQSPVCLRGRWTRLSAARGLRDDATLCGARPTGGAAWR
jgi:hypothetical protein